MKRDEQLMSVDVYKNDSKNLLFLEASLFADLQSFPNTSWGVQHFGR